MYKTYSDAVFEESESDWHIGEDDTYNGFRKRSYVTLVYGKEQHPQHGLLSPCTARFRSPIEDILEMYRELSLQVSVIAAIN